MEVQSEDELDGYITTSETVEDDDSVEEENQEGLKMTGTCEKMAEKKQKKLKR
ncbi:hypothetical protein E2C01_078917 [Portunus trituberculatus]|uniref:Uncharacterized protein n=1 Tax=Portunus trituberculatus TaxID=210409 RepID=A0A5B7IQ02_PORTR|nr:hypothetical protein [Portunus trituberculatus]